MHGYVQYAIVYPLWLSVGAFSFIFLQRGRFACSHIVQHSWNIDMSCSSRTTPNSCWWASESRVFEPTKRTKYHFWYSTIFLKVTRVSESMWFVVDYFLQLVLGEWRTKRLSQGESDRLLSRKTLYGCRLFFQKFYSPFIRKVNFDWQWISWTSTECSKRLVLVSESWSTKPELIISATTSAITFCSHASSDIVFCFPQ